MTAKSIIRAEAEQLHAALLAAGASAIEADILLPAGTLLDLYGEDIRARAYVTADPLNGEMMLRPDFTVPVVQAHMSGGADPARYAYMGEVFRRQEHLDGRAREYMQVGYEVFDRDASKADAEVFALFDKLLAGLNLRPETGDIGILMAAVRGLSTTERRKAALLRHIWRPQRFRALLDRFAGRAPISATHSGLLQRLAAGDPLDLVQAAGPLVGLRSAEDIAARAEALLEDAKTPAIAAPEAALLYDLLSLEAPARAALEHLRGIAPMLPAILPAVEAFAARLDALASRGIDVTRLPFAASHGRSTLEYYDGFVFTFQGPAGLPAIASGGRYDALTAVLGAGKSIPAVGGIIRPGLVARLRGAL
ncbi:ATP phosphoribosyltransferase regulatory subunit [Xinfangfangia sp. CPCC 101601]|uniref:ATP phosphoribosyltransferase regulatory subunit n=1 Tax=Pseudogemmobacter lacusdianii TaxID=3069608 RepID=A0ABU0VXH4_9RHOB|nr:ATP phosphoribosyltransferase regulatory subunit [Xinfangfangia sp. CPCC 101601]MDQ2066208.1 ATP phosphoribosyltransferase regulatory subunit [Xinfangfangia sp. CPCC 101601]